MKKGGDGGARGRKQEARSGDEGLGNRDRGSGMSEQGARGRKQEAGGGEEGLEGRARLEARLVG